MSQTTRALALLAPLSLAQLLIGLDYNIVYVALPEIASLGFSPESLQWVVSAYAIAFGGFLLLAGRLTDALGRRRLFLLGLLLMGLGSLAAAFASAEWMLVAGRGIQGLGGAALAPSTLALLTAGFAEGPARNKALGVWGAAGSAGMVLGSILGGVLAEAWGWRSVFLVNVPLLLVILALALRAIPADPPRTERIRLDVPGAILTTSAASLVVLGFVLAAEAGWGPSVAWLLLGGVAAVVGLVLVERRVAEPLLDLRLLARRHLAVGTASTFLFMASFGATAYFLTLYFQDTRGLSPLLTGLAFIVPCLAVLVGTSLGARLSTQHSLRAAMVTGQAIGVVGCAAIALLVDAATAWPLVFALVATFSLGQGIVFTVMFATATTGTPDAEQGIASGVATTGQQLGGAIGLAVLVTIVQAGDAPALTTAMWAIAALIAVGALVALAIPRTTPPVPAAAPPATERCHH